MLHYLKQCVFLLSDFQCIAIRESKSPKGREALKKLQEQYIKCKNDDLRQAQEYLGVALVEVLLLLQVSTQKLIYLLFLILYKLIS